MNVFYASETWRLFIFCRKYFLNSVLWKEKGGRKTNENHSAFVWRLMNKALLEPNSGSGFVL